MNAPAARSSEIIIPKSTIRCADQECFSIDSCDNNRGKTMDTDCAAAERERRGEGAAAAVRNVACGECHLSKLH